MSEATRLWIGIVFLSLYLIVVLFAGNAYVRLANRRWLEAHEAAMRSAAGHGRRRRSGRDRFPAGPRLRT
jgi:hypothetical protein